jgi:hypothetical protein
VDDDTGEVFASALAISNGGTSSLQQQVPVNQSLLPDRQQGADGLPFHEQSAAGEQWPVEAAQVQELSTSSKPGLFDTSKTNGIHVSPTTNGEEQSHPGNGQGDDHLTLTPPEKAHAGGDGNGWAVDTIMDVSDQGTTPSTADARPGYLGPAQLAQAAQPTIENSNSHHGGSAVAAVLSSEPSSSLANLDSMSHSDLIELVRQLHDSVQARQGQLVRQAEHMSQLQKVSRDRAACASTCSADHIDLQSRAS